jgi:site-specific DNA-methyltransferase (adenine-specific)
MKLQIPRAKRDDYITPKWLFDLLHKEFRFDMDVACSNNNLLPMFISKDINSLKQHWFNSIYCNPPYSNNMIEAFIKHGLDELEHKHAKVIVYLLPCKTDSKWFHDYILNYASEIRFIYGRLRFMNSKYNAPFPSIVCIFKENRNSLKISSIKRCSAE